ncbi:hypothetical protein N5853_00745 [Bartonella sp. HY329]|uniref:hypothetical protein n=1 Tax=unclassified Bartonella TaxID=2645622 RepID=UPI0021C623FA|nr:MULTISPECIES: hypothetical protein [unclassified Bartonella]UXM95220.1 hypothetical protein N5853_00745 [Bartonella sp. HY329]UXN09543.1 hypothetical protein N5852_00750 [Bartonella sp. HY328]
MQPWDIDDINPLIDLGGGFSAVDIWYEIHADAQFWLKNRQKSEDWQEQIAVSLRMAEKLQTFPAQNWISLNHAIGWTKEAATALTWCENAVLKDIFTIWNKLDFKVAPQPNYEFAALLINPIVLPENRLSKIIECGEHNISSVCLLLAARSDLPEIDLPIDLQNRLPHEVVNMLRACGY